MAQTPLEVDKTCFWEQHTDEKRCRALVLDLTQNTTNCLYRQCRNTQMTGRNFCRVHQERKTPVYDWQSSYEKFAGGGAGRIDPQPERPASERIRNFNSQTETLQIKLQKAIADFRVAVEQKQQENAIELHQLNIRYNNQLRELDRINENYQKTAQKLRDLQVMKNELKDWQLEKENLIKQQEICSKRESELTTKLNQEIELKILIEQRAESLQKELRKLLEQEENLTTALENCKRLNAETGVEMEGLPGVEFTSVIQNMESLTRQWLLPESSSVINPTVATPLPRTTAPPSISSISTSFGKSVTPSIETKVAAMDESSVEVEEGETAGEVAELRDLNKLPSNAIDVIKSMWDRAARGIVMKFDKSWQSAKRPIDMFAWKDAFVTNYNQRTDQSEKRWFLSKLEGTETWEKVRQVLVRNALYDPKLLTTEILDLIK